MFDLRFFSSTIFPEFFDLTELYDPTPRNAKRLLYFLRELRLFLRAPLSGACEMPLQRQASSAAQEHVLTGSQAIHTIDRDC